MRHFPFAASRNTSTPFNYMLCQHISIIQLRYIIRRNERLYTEFYPACYLLKVDYVSIIVFESSACAAAGCVYLNLRLFIL